ncbi:hypothetical protein C8Q77DRAFT_428611 [Trametes polyzona]|nr:hypothetical protein C8Q77DRAFT_428611 [Trametes polyzona]
MEGRGRRRDGEWGRLAFCFERAWIREAIAAGPKLKYATRAVVVTHIVPSPAIGASWSHSPPWLCSRSRHSRDPALRLSTSCFRVASTARRTPPALAKLLLAIASAFSFVRTATARPPQSSRDPWVRFHSMTALLSLSDCASVDLILSTRRDTCALPANRNHAAYVSFQASLPRRNPTDLPDLRPKICSLNHSVITKAKSRRAQRGPQYCRHPGPSAQLRPTTRVIPLHRSFT